MSIPPTAHPLSYRPEIDGLRAVAVMAVVFFHAELKFHGGYVGVDVFFVISGYLITSLILRDLNEGKFSFLDFWERRARRIFPALGAMIAGTLLMGALVMLPYDFEELGRSVVAQAVMAANFFFWREDLSRGGYFGAAAEERPLLHTWSLAVEEQYYVLLPLLLVVAFRFRWFRHAGRMSGVFFLMILAGLAVAVSGVEYHPEAAFYLLHARAWELLLGSLVAALPLKALPRHGVVREGASWIGLAGIVVPFVLYTKETPFPGWAALPPCVGAALVIWGNSRKGSARLTLAGRLLAWKPVVAVGLVSYSLYLWHWPVLVLGKYWWPNPWISPWYFRAGLVGISMLLAVLSWWLVETPFRKKRVFASRRAVLRFAGLATAFSLLVGGLVVAGGGMPTRFDERVAENDAAKRDRLIPEKMLSEADDVRGNRLVEMGAGDGPVRILLWGDSHAMHAVAAVDGLCSELNIRGAAATYPATPPLLEYVPRDTESLQEKAPEFTAAVADYIRRESVPHVILAARWGKYQLEDAERLSVTLRETIHGLRSMGVIVWVLQDIPDVDAQAPVMLAREAALERQGGEGFRRIWGALPSAYSDAFALPVNPWRRTLEDHRRKNGVLYEIAASGLPATFIDPSPRLLDEETGFYRAELDGISVYYDGDHLTRKASKRLLLPLFREAMRNGLVRN